MQGERGDGLVLFEVAFFCLAVFFLPFLLFCVAINDNSTLFALSQQGVHMPALTGVK